MKTQSHSHGVLYLHLMSPHSLPVSGLPKWLPQPRRKFLRLPLRRHWSHLPHWGLIKHLLTSWRPTQASSVQHVCHQFFLSLSNTSPHFTFLHFVLSTIA